MGNVFAPHRRGSTDDNRVGVLEVGVCPAQAEDSEFDEYDGVPFG